MVDDAMVAPREATGLFRRPGLADPAVGGKARALARLAACGLPVPPAVVIVSTPAAPVVEAGKPAPPEALRTASELATLDEARAALRRAPFTAAFERGLTSALAALAPDTSDEVTFSVRSSAPLKDSAEAAAPGLFDSVLRVPRAAVGEAVRAVLASALAPAAWAYVLRAPATSQGAMAVLVHRFVPGDARGAEVCDTGDASVQLHVQEGRLAAAARAAIESGARQAAAPVPARGGRGPGRGRRRAWAGLGMGRGPQPRPADAGAGGAGRMGRRAVRAGVSPARRARIYDLSAGPHRYARRDAAGAVSARAGRRAG